MIRFCDGFDLCTYTGAALKYNGYNATFNQGQMITGRDGLGQALWLFNTAFGEANYTVILDAQSTYGFNMDWQWSAGSPSTREWYRIGYLGTTLLSLRYRPDGTMDILGPLGAVLVNTVATSTTFTPGVYCTLELVAAFGTSGTVSLFKNGVLAATKSGVNFGSVLPDRHTFRFQGFGPPGIVLDNLIIWDGQSGDPFTGQYGRQRILSIEPAADLQAGEWSPSVPGPSFAMVDDNPSSSGGSPNGDINYLLALGTGPDAVFSMAKSDCSGLVLALAWNACARPDPTSANPLLDFVYIPALATLTVGNQRVAAVGHLNPDAPFATIDYFTYQVISKTNPVSGSNWQDTEISDGAFGCGAVATPQVRMTAFYLEKIIDLTGKPFNCGGGPTSFGGS